MTDCEICQGQGHVLSEKTGKYERCQCIEERVKEQILGIFYTSRLAKKSNLSDLTNQNAVIEAPLESLRPHMARVVLDLMGQGKKITWMECYRLIEIFLEKDAEFITASRATESDLFILLMGFGDPKNRYLPELIGQVIGRRKVMRRPTWVILGLELSSVGMKYGIEIANELEKFKKVKIR